VLIETASEESVGHIRLLLRLAQQGLELCAFRQERSLRFTEATTIGPEVASAVGLLVGSVAMRQVLEAIHRIRSSDVTVLITGESGTGKSLVAKAIHSNGPYASKPFVRLIVNL